VLPYEEIHRIKEEILKICEEKNNKVFIEDLSIDKNDPLYSVMLRESLLIMERNYLKIFNINEIANILRINESTLFREFSKFGLPSPKKILMFLKVRHAIKLMQNKGLNVREISSLSGFTDEKRMAECFHRMFGMAPGEYREKHVDNEYVIK
jgi:transcriptional regulator GlxA family with amidase domain